MDSIHAVTLIKFIGDKFPKIVDIGLLNVQAAIKILIHSENILMMNKYILQIEKLCKEGESDWQYYAMLADRISVIQNIAQTYGTQFVKNKHGEMELYPYDDIHKVNARRVKIGLRELP